MRINERDTTDLPQKQVIIIGNPRDRSDSRITHSRIARDLQRDIRNTRLLADPHVPVIVRTVVNTLTNAGLRFESAEALIDYVLERCNG